LNEADALADDSKPPSPTDLDVRPKRVEYFYTSDLTDAVRTFNVDLAVRFGSNDTPPRPRRSVNLMVDLELVISEASLRGRQTLRYFESRLALANERLLQRRLTALRVPQRAVPVKATRLLLEDPEVSEPFSLAAIVPLILILMTITGAVYPAIDLTAGERERGTLEILVAAPVPRIDVLLAKYVAVFTVAVLTATVNLATMSVTLVISGIGTSLFGASGLTTLVVIQVFLLLLLFAAFFSAVLLAVSCFARSFKEAQAALVPLMLVSMAPGMAALMPGLSLSGLLSFVPLLNIVLLARDLFEGTVQPLPTVVVVISTLLYAVAAISLAARVFGTESVLFSSHAGWLDLFRRPREPRRTASLSAAMFCVALLFPASVLLNGAVARFGGPSMAARLLLACMVSLLLFTGLPLAAACLERLRFQDGFSLHRASWAAFAGALLLGLSLWTIAVEVVVMTLESGVITLAPEQLQQASEVVKQLMPLPLIVILLTIAIVPAVVEEFFFRGYLFNTLRERTEARTAIVASAVLFGLFHVVAPNTLTFERFVPSTCMGMVLAWVCWRTGSVVPGMVLHACHNAMPLLLGHYREDVLGFSAQSAQIRHLPAELVLAGSAVAAIGAGIIWTFCRPQPADRQSNANSTATNSAVLPTS
jgi:ABC-2 type transport system permease protein/sodium transport system permease protein